jgi:ribonucleotide reductase beta subunit family protein with ferritin-like domain
MKIFQAFVLSMSIFFLWFWVSSAWFFDSFIDSGTPDIRYCDGADDCGLDEGVAIIKDSLNDIETDRPLSEYIQDVLIYALTFITILAVLYIIYAGFMIMVANGDEEKVKKSKQIILYILIWIVVIWLAWPITRFIMGLLMA